MSRPPETLAERVERWLRLAREDLLLAEHALADPDVVRRGACVWAQQAAEKALKALIVSENTDPPKIHNLMHLERLVPAAVSEGLAPLDLEGLTRWAIEGRYPDDFEEATTTDAETAVATAAAVLLLAETALDRAPLGDRAQEPQVDPELALAEQQPDEPDLAPTDEHGEHR
ncbi:MAG: HEPN domain-containing protein [Egibacteraceae bacterium]